MHAAISPIDLDHPPSPRGETASVARSGEEPLAPISKRALWAGRILSGISVLFLLFDATVKVLQLPPAMEGTAELGYPTSVVLGLGLVQVLCLIAYVLPRTSVLGAILWTGYLGGAVATHVRVGNPLFSHVLSPVYVATLLWLGLWLRDRRLQALVPMRTGRQS